MRRDGIKKCWSVGGKEASFHAKFGMKLKEINFGVFAKGLDARVMFLLKISNF